LTTRFKKSWMGRSVPTDMTARPHVFLLRSAVQCAQRLGGEGFQEQIVQAIRFHDKLLFVLKYADKWLEHGKHSEPYQRRPDATAPAMKPQTLKVNLSTWPSIGLRVKVRPGPGPRPGLRD
jgi:hypothetical protein